MEMRRTICYNCFQEKPEEGPCPHCGFDLAENEKKFPVALRAGTVLNGRYIVGRVLGQGGFGITYLALDTQLNAKVAVKEFMPGEIATRQGTTVSVMMDTKSEEFSYGAERFQEEARTLAKFIGNPNIAAVTSYFDENDTSYFVMDYIEGISFKTYIANHGGKISVDETLNVMIPVLRALTAVHAEGFIHRDVTPDNIYITKDGQVKLLDFGSARYSIGDKSKSLDVILKVGYAPKEQYIRRSRQGPFTDVYSCAACFYAAITGFLPPESLERLDSDTLVPISQTGIEIPEYLDKAILKGLAVQPEDRFQSAAEFLEAIESQRVVEVPTAGGAAAPTVGGQVDAIIGKVKQKPRLYGAIAAAAAVVLIAAGVLSGGGNSVPDDPGGDLSAVEGGEIFQQPEIQEPEPEPEPEPVTLTIAGEEHSSNDTYLSLWQVELTAEDIETICQMPKLEELSIYECYSDDDFAFLPRLTSLKSLDWTLNNGEQLVHLTDCTQLTSLRIGWGDGNLVSSNLDFLAGMTDLESLDIHVYGLEDTSALANLTKLTHFTIAGGQIRADMSVLAGMTEMVDLQINSSNIRSSYPPYDKNGYVAPDLSFMANMSKLESAFLYFEGNVDSISGLEGAVNLRDLDMTVGSITTLEPFASLTNLRKLELDVSASNLSLEPLRGLEKLETFVTYSSRHFTDWSALDHVPSVDRRA